MARRPPKHMSPEVRDLLRDVGREALRAREKAGQELAIADRSMRLGHCWEAGEWIRGHMRRRGEAYGLARAARMLGGGREYWTSRPRWQRALEATAADVIRRYEDSCTSMHSSGEDVATFRQSVSAGFRSLRSGDCEAARRAIAGAQAVHRRLDQMWPALQPLEDEEDVRLRETGPEIRQSTRRMEVALSRLSSAFRTHCVQDFASPRFGGRRRRQPPLLEF